MKYLYAIAIGLIFLGVALVGVMFQNLNELADYKRCYNEPITELSQHCKDLLDGK